MSPALAGGFLTTALTGKSLMFFFNSENILSTCSDFDFAIGINIVLLIQILDNKFVTIFTSLKNFLIETINIQYDVNFR